MARLAENLGRGTFGDDLPLQHHYGAVRDAADGA
jgi:hypothetical protein